MAKPGRPETDLEKYEDIMRGGTGKIESYLRRLLTDYDKYLNKIETTCLLMQGATKDFRRRKKL